MSSAHATPNAAAAPVDRRSHPRETPEWLALVFLGEDNWGKLLNLSETGMAFEFSQPVSLQTSSTFVLESIRLVSAQDGELALNSIQTPGQIVWTHDSGRTAGVRFTENSGETRLQIQSWLSGKPLPVAPAANPLQPSQADELTPAMPLGPPELEPLSLHSLAPSESKPIPEFDVLPVSERHAPDEGLGAAPLPLELFPAIVPVEQPPRGVALPLVSDYAPSPEASPQLEPTRASLGPVCALPRVDLAWLRAESPVPMQASSHAEQSDSEHLQLSFDQLPISGGVRPPPSSIAQAAEPAFSDDSLKPATPAAPVEPVLVAAAPVPSDLSLFSASTVSEPSDAKQAEAFLSARPALTIHAPGGPNLSRFTVLALAVTFAAVTAAAALTFAWPHRARIVALLSNIRRSSARNSAPPSADPASRASAQAEMLGSSNNKPLSSTQPKPAATFAKPAPAVPRSRTQQPQPEAVTKRPSFPAIRLATPVFSALAKPVTLEDAPSVAAGVSADAAPSRDPFGGILANSRQPVPAAPETAPPPHPEAPAPVVGGRVELPRLISSVPPVYPPIAASRRIEGDVTIDALIDTSGRVSEMKVVSGTVLLREAALDALRKWRYQPARLDGQATSIHMQITVKFRAK